jgi:glyoxylase-like metal-dependent hydrolase (beta-lactamase superfamily II)
MPGLDIIDTPGHASHHLAYSWGGGLFAGEAAGNFYAFKDMEYLRPATPPRFYRDVFLASLDQLATLDNQPIYYAHLGRARDSREMLKRFRAQILRWNDLIQKEMDHGGEDMADRCVKTLLQKDPELQAFSAMDQETQQRERYFIRNSVKGFLGFLSA